MPVLQGAKMDSSSHKLFDSQWCSQEKGHWHMPVPAEFQPCVSWPLQFPVPSGWSCLVPAQAQAVLLLQIPPFCCSYCSMACHSLGALQSHVTSQHFTQTESTFTCELCRKLFPSQGKLEGHLSTEHPKVAFSQATTAHFVQVTQMSEQGAAEHIIFYDAKLVTLPESQVNQTGSELVAVTMEDLFDDKDLFDDL